MKTKQIHARDLVEEPLRLDVSSAPCPTCHAHVGWACGDSHCDGAHRARVLARLRQLGRVVRVDRRMRGDPFYFDLTNQRYYDLVPGYLTTFVQREDVKLPLNRDHDGFVRGMVRAAPVRVAR